MVFCVKCEREREGVRAGLCPECKAQLSALPPRRCALCGAQGWGEFPTLCDRHHRVAGEALDVISQEQDKLPRLFTGGSLGWKIPPEFRKVVLIQGEKVEMIPAPFGAMLTPKGTFLQASLGGVIIA